MNLQSLCEKANGIVLETGTFIREQSQRLHEITIEEKDINSLVSYVDRKAEEQLVTRLGELLPDAGFITEEDTPNIEGKEWEWIIDPLDGTTNFLYGVPCFSISVGLRHEKKLVAGIIYEISQNELFEAWENAGAFLNKKPIHVSARTKLSESLLATGFPYYDFSLIGRYMKSFTHLLRNSRGIRRLGSAAVDLAYVACGRFDGFFEYSLNPWDVAAGAVIVKEAGGTVIDFSGGSDYLFGREIIATNPHIAAELKKILNHDFHEDFSGKKMIADFADKLKERMKNLPGHTAQEKMAPEHRLPHEQWERYFTQAKKGGVLILFYPIQSGIHTVLIQRPQYDGVHSGQVAFPGGAKEESDASMIATALREAEEEVGICKQLVNVIGQLTELYIPPSNFLITPVVGFSSERPDFRIDTNEVVEIIEPTVSELLDERAVGRKKIKVRSDIAIEAPYYDIQGRMVWGATAMMISELNEILKKIMSGKY